MIPAAMPKPQNRARHGGTLKLHRGAIFGEVSKPPHCPQSPHIPPHLRFGTAVANYISILGEPANCAQTERRGGARNRANRESHALNKRQIANLEAAERHAWAIGLPFTRMVTIHWQAAGVPLEGMVRATGRYIDLLTRWLARKGHRTAWIWVLENGHGKGGHCHLLVHVPAPLVRDLVAKAKQWLRAITGKPYRKRVLCSRPIGGWLGIEKSNPESYAANATAALAYLVKGADSEAAAAFGLERLQPGGRIIGRRCSASQNINAKARKAKD